MKESFISRALSVACSFLSYEFLLASDVVIRKIKEYFHSRALTADCSFLLTIFLVVIRKITEFFLQRTEAK
jgi:uncharacterized membrane protein YozB (DUF420 family)